MKYYISSTNTSNTALFIDWWNRRVEKASVIVPEGINAVNIMTIHASKGLEFPIVITPYLAWGIEKEESLWIDIQQEQLNLPVALINTNKTINETAYKNLAEKEQQQQILDNLNLLYVDFTRAVDRLHIISPKLKKENSKNCHTWLLDFMSSQSTFNPANQYLKFGNLIPKNATGHTKNGLPQLQINQLEFNKNTDTIKIKGSSAYNSNEEITKAREYGILVHYILSKINSKYDVDSVIQQTILAGDIAQEEGDKIAQEIKKIISINTISHYFEPGLIVKNEFEILNAHGEILRPDRVVIENNDAVIIDYKTGKKQAQKYHQQMQSYELALLELGYSSVKKILLYIHEQEVEIL